MATFKYIYVGGEYDHWDAKGKIFVSNTTSQKDLEYLHSLNVDGVVKTEVKESKKGK